MKILSIRLVSCETEKVEYKNYQEQYDDYPNRKKDGWHVVKTYNKYDECYEPIVKYNCSNKSVIFTYVRYGYINMEDHND